MMSANANQTFSIVSSPVRGRLDDGVSFDGDVDTVVVVGVVGTVVVVVVASQFGSATNSRTADAVDGSVDSEPTSMPTASVVGGQSAVAVVWKQPESGSLVHDSVAFGGLPSAHAGLPFTLLAVASTDSAGCAAVSTSERSSTPSVSVISCVWSTSPVSASRTVNTIDVNSAPPSRSASETVTAFQ